MRCAFVIFLSISIPALAFAFAQVDLLGEYTFVEEPAAVAVDEEGKIYTADEKGTITVMDAEGSPLDLWSWKNLQSYPELKSPSGIAPYSNRLYITDSSSDRVFIFSKKGRYIDSFGGSGSEPKRFNGPQGIFVNEGVVYVADSGNKRVQVFSFDGIYMGSTFGEKNRSRLERPIDVVIDYRGYSYVLDGKLKMVQIFTHLGKHYRNVILLELPDPVAIASDKNGFFVASKDHKLIKFGFDGEPVYYFGAEGNNSGQFLRISDVAVNEKGDFIVSDSKKRTVQVFSPAKKKVPANTKNATPPTSARWLKNLRVKDIWKILWDTEGTLYATNSDKDSIVIIKNGRAVRTFKFDDIRPLSIAKGRDGSLWVADGKKDRILKMDGGGRILSAISSSGGKEGRLSEPYDIAVSKTGFIYVADRGNGRISVFNAENGIFTTTLGDKKGSSSIERPLAVALDGSDNLYVLDDKKHSVMGFAPNGKFLGSFGREGKGPGEFEDPVDIVVSGQEVYVLDRGLNRVQVFDLRGKFLRLFGAEGDGKGDFDGPVSMSMEDDGETLYVSDPGNDRVQVIGILHTPFNFRSD